MFPRIRVVFTRQLEILVTALQLNRSLRAGIPFWGLRCYLVFSLHVFAQRGISQNFSKDFSVKFGKRF